MPRISRSRSEVSHQRKRVIVVMQIKQKMGYGIQDTGYRIQNTLSISDQSLAIRTVIHSTTKAHWATKDSVFKNRDDKTLFRSF